MRIDWREAAHTQYLYWVKNNPAIKKKINALIRDIIANHPDGIGKPEKLKHNLSGYWSRRINAEHRLVYAVAADHITIVSCRFHY